MLLSQTNSKNSKNSSIIKNYHCDTGIELPPGDEPPLCPSLSHFHGFTNLHLLG
jgi:hypothetical protein